MNRPMEDIRDDRPPTPGDPTVTAGGSWSSAGGVRMDFLARVSHDLRTQVHALQGYSELLGHVTRNGPGAELAASVHQRALALQSLVDDLLDVTEAAGGRLGVRPVPTDVRALVATAVTTATMAESLPDVEVRIAVADDVPDHLVIDGRRVQQVLANLLSNALRFTADGWIDVIVTTAGDAGGQNAGGTVRFDVNDTGPGIPCDAVDRIFLPFGRPPNQPARGSEGTGLGLTIVHDVVTAMGGSVGVDSDPGQGSTFWFTVPCAADATADATPDAAAEPVAVAPPDAHVAATILVVDDSDTNRQLVDRQLRTLGHEVVLAPGGRDALAVMDADIDLVLMDLNMPDLDGVETTRRLRALGWTTPIVALTAAAMTSDRAMCFAVGMDDFLAKPIGMHDLGAAIDRVLGRTGTVAAAPVPAGTPAGRGPAANTAVEALLRDIGPDATLGLFEVFLIESAVQEQAIATAAGAKDEDAFRRANHTLASTSALVGGGDLEALCRAGERGGLQETNIGEFLAQLDTLLGSLRVDVRGLAEVIARRGRMIAAR